MMRAGEREFSASILDARCARGTTKKARVAAGFSRKSGLWRANISGFINLLTAGDDMAKYSNPRALKQRVRHE